MTIQLKTSVALLGAAIGAAAMAGLAALLGPIVLAIAAGIVLVGYIAAATMVGSAFSEFLRGLLIGVNAGLNGVLLTTILSGPLGMPTAAAVGLGLGALTFLAVLGPVANNDFYQGVIGWANWLLPMSWLVAGLGFLFYLLNLIGHAIFHGIFKIAFFQITGFAADWKTGTFFTHGGWISNLNPIDTAFNMGNFSYVDNASSAMHIEHEAGHTLNLAAFGSLFHFIGAIDENVTGGGHRAFSERLAESNDPATALPSVIIPMWI